jgi:hypothetical protein
MPKKTKPSKIQARIFRHYGTKKINQIYAEAAAKRAGTEHEELCGGNESKCQTCGLLTPSTADPLFHPEEFIGYFK